LTGFDHPTDTDVSAPGRAPVPAPAPATPGEGLFYGWVIVGAVFAVLMVASGLGFYNASVILSAATDELGVSVGAVSGATALFFAVSGITSFVLSRQLDARDIRWFYGAGGLFGFVALGSLHWVRSVAQLYAFFAVFGLAFAAAGLVPGTTLITRWFDRRRAIALSVASTGLSIGGIVLTPIAVWLIDRRTLAGAGPPLAVMWLFGVAPIGLLLLRSRPSDKGLVPDGTRTNGDNADSADSGAGGQPGSAFAFAATSRLFLLLCLAYTLIYFAQVGALAHLFNVASERTDKATAGTALSLLALASVVGRLIGGVVVLRVPIRALSAGLALLQAISLLALAASTSSPAIVGSAVVLGLSVGNLLMLQPLILAEAFGVASYSRIYSLSQMISTVGVAGGPAALGLIHDQSDYRTAFLVAGMAGAAGFVSFLAAGSIDAARSRWDPAGADQGPGTGSAMA
jgi:sugar phosphate permease